MDKLALGNITEWKHEGIQKRQKNTLLSFWKKSKPSVSTSRINTAEQTEPDVEILLTCEEAKSSKQTIVASSSLSSLNQQVADPDSLLFIYKCDIWVDVRRYYGFCYFILKTLQIYHNFWYHYGSQNAPDSFCYLNSQWKFVTICIYLGTWEGGRYTEIVTNGDMGGVGSKTCKFCGEVLFERPQRCLSVWEHE